MRAEQSNDKVVTKSIIKFVHSLGIKKFRDAERCFVAEGPKVVADLLPLMHCRMLFATDAFLHTLGARVLQNVGKIETISQSELERLSQLRAPRDVVAVFDFFDDFTSADYAEIPSHALCLALDGVQDPGNLGTILRVADWFGVEHVFASPDTADVYAPKVVQATMGAVGRIKVHYLDLPRFLHGLPADVPVFGTFLDGDDIYTCSLSDHGVIVMGNEGNGISSAVEATVTRKLFIPSYPVGRPTSESLNVAIATSIVCAEFRRR